MMQRLHFGPALDLAAAPWLDAWQLRQGIARFRVHGEYPARAHAGAARTNGATRKAAGWSRHRAGGEPERIVLIPANDAAGSPLPNDHSPAVPFRLRAVEADAHLGQPGPRDARMRRWARRGAKVALATSALTLTLMPVLALIVPVGLAHARRDAVGARYAQLRGLTTAIEVRDAAGRYVGQVEQLRNPSSHLVLRARTVPTPMFAMLTWLEDRQDGGLVRDWYGLNLSGLTRTGVCIVTGGRVASHDGECGGGSSLMMQAARGAHGWWGGSANWRERKRVELMDAPALSLIYPRGSEGHRRFIVDALTYGYTDQGYELWGIRNASLITFGVEPERLSLAQQAVLAAMPKRRLVLRCGAADLKTRDRDERAWAGTRDRADLALRSAFDPSAPEIAAARAELARMARPARPAPLDPALAVGLDATAACKFAGHPRALFGNVASSERAATLAELRTDAHRGTVEQVELSVDIAAQRRFKISATAMLDDLGHAQRANLDLPLVGAGAAHTLMMATRNDGGFSHLFASSPRPLLDEPRRVGSIGKLVVALAAARQGYSADTALCDLRDRSGLRNAGGGGGHARCIGDARLSVREAFARSNNLAILDLANRVGPEAIRAALAASGFDVRGHPDPGRALVTGMAEASPRQIAAFMQALANGISGNAPVATRGHIIARIRRDGVWEGARRDVLALPAPYFATPQARQFLAAAAQAAFAGQYGTLRALAAAAPPLPGEIAKSGTVAGPRPQLATLASLAAGAAPGRHGWMTFSAAPSHQLGNRALRLAPIPVFLRRELTAKR